MGDDYRTLIGKNMVTSDSVITCAHRIMGHMPPRHKLDVITLAVKTKGNYRIRF